MKRFFSRRIALQVLAGALVCALPINAPAKSRRHRSHRKTAKVTKPTRAAANKTLAGVWQAAPMMGAAWANTYRFYSDGRVYFHTSQTNCQSRLRGWSGRYFLAGDKILFAIAHETRHIGGTLKKASGSCATPQELRGGRESTRRLRPERRQTLSFQGVRADEDNGRPMTMIGQERLWKFQNQAQKYP